LYALRESLRIIAEEGLPARFARHHLNSRALMAGLLALGFDPLPPVNYRLPTLICVTVPTSIDEGAVRSQLLEQFDIEIGGGLGHLKGKVWRIGLMGESSTEANVLTLLNALEEIGIQNGWVSIPGIALQAAASTYSRGR
jgi:alanine-glyoxylate transaminase/serine-glyoxylate transaminase/serine-pyruvate transaminase